MFQAGYLFKPSHTDIHYVRRGHGQPGDDYRNNFTQNVAEAKHFATKKEALDAILWLMEAFEPDPEYCWTPVAIDTDTGLAERVFSTSFAK